MIPTIFSQYGNLFEATGPNSTLSLPALTSISENNTENYD